VPIDRLAVSPPCGFASTSEGNRLSPDDQRQKLEIVAATAQAVWPTSRSAKA
jgi:5-methyltetrahydropteroyltriglutamate--homocysteine methyltransferase